MTLGEQKMSSTQHRNLQGQKALVTGATSGLGRAIAFQLGRDGAEVVVHGRDAARGAETIEAITAAGGLARFVAADLSDPADLRRLAEDVGDIDILVNNAGFSVFGATADLKVDTFDALFASNVRAPFFLVAAFAPGMAARGKGSIINVSSMAGQIGLAGAAAYGATKAALSSMTRAWAAEFSPSGVRVNAIAPGPVYTGGAAPERTKALGATTLLKRAADAEEIAEVVGFLASPLASYITGAIVAADGGRTAI
jgi:NAD(P)-dependent dehydrogenase (short-subunit alcohol dehydrogenase family)